ncbi:hypothetical protein HanRHA438_Chr13g0604731 [Helianthus annuus]|nr:hypothetical protein HanRHA438_Chr13g0604731 [Helianthus annuus]
MFRSSYFQTSLSPICLILCPSSTNSSPKVRSSCTFSVHIGGGGAGIGLGYSATGSPYGYGSSSISRMY